MPVVNARRSPRNANWRGHEAVLGEDRAQPREGVEGRVRGEDEDQGRERQEHEVAQRAGHRTRAPPPAAMTVTLVVGHHTERAGHERDAHEQRAPAGRPSRRGCVAAFLDSGGLNAGTPVAIASDAGERDRAATRRPAAGAAGVRHRRQSSAPHRVVDGRRRALALAPRSGTRPADHQQRARPRTGTSGRRRCCPTPAGRGGCRGVISDDEASTAISTWNGVQVRDGRDDLLAGGRDATRRPSGCSR